MQDNKVSILRWEFLKNGPKILEINWDPVKRVI